MQLVWDREERTTKPYPDLETGEERRAFDENHILVVPEWGGKSAFGSDWTYSVEKCREWARGDAFLQETE